MKHIQLIILTSLLLVACGGDKKKNTVESVLETNNLETIRAKRAELVENQEEINAKIKQLDEAIAKIDTVKKVPLITTITAKTEVFNHQLEIQGNVTTKNLLVITPEFSSNGF